MKWIEARRGGTVDAVAAGVSPSLRPRPPVPPPPAPADPPAPRRRRHRLGWAVVTPLAVLAVAWVLRLDRWLLPVSLAVTFLPLVLVPAWLVLAGAAAGRRWRLATTAGLVAVIHLAAVVPTLPRSASAVRADGARLRIVTANAWFRNPTPEAWAMQLLALDADVLLIQEYAPSIADALVLAGLKERYRFRKVWLAPYSAGVAMFSRIELHDTSLPTFGEDGVAATLEVGGTRVRLLNVHVAGLPDQSAWRRSFTELDRYVDDQPEPLVAAGDFNATLWHGPMRDLLDGALRDAHADAGQAWDTTWPVGKPGPPFALLDHVLVTPTIEVERIAERPLAGADHRAVVADLRLPAP